MVESQESGMVINGSHSITDGYHGNGWFLKQNLGMTLFSFRHIPKLSITFPFGLYFIFLSGGGSGTDKFIYPSGHRPD